LIKPLTQLFIYYVVMGKFLGAARGIPEFAIYVYTGLAAYSLFSEIISSSTSSIVGNSGLIKKIYIPREVFPLASVGSALFNFAIQLAVLLGATIVLGSPPWSLSILYFIPALITLVIYGFALGLLFAALNVYLRDIQYLIEVVLMVLLWASPIVYSWTMVKTQLGSGILSDIYASNPVTLAVLGFQKAFWMAGASAEYPSDLPMRFVITIIIGLIALFAAHRVFVRLQGNFAQEL
jgi:ABC-2 type transport system permease protein